MRSLFQGGLLVSAVCLATACSREESKSKKTDAPEAKASLTQKSEAPPAPIPPAAEKDTLEKKLRQSEVSVFVLQEVEDADAHRALFKKNAPAREKAGVLGYMLSHQLDNPKKFIVHYAARSEQQVKDFLASETYAEYEAADEITNSSLLWYANNQLIEISETLPKKSFSLYKKFPVKDPALFEKEIRKGLDTLKTEGLSLITVHQMSLNEEVVVVHLSASSKEELTKAYEGEVFSAARKSSGATDWQDPTLLVDER